MDRAGLKNDKFQEFGSSGAAGTEDRNGIAAPVSIGSRSKLTHIGEFIPSSFLNTVIKKTTDIYCQWCCYKTRFNHRTSAVMSNWLKA